MESASDPLTELLEAQGVALLDGALATELERRGLVLDDRLWSAAALVEAPALVRRLHLDYLEAGADVIVSASYQASFEGFVRHGLSDAEAEAAIRRSVELAHAARDTFWAEPAHRRGRRRPLVAAGVGPYGAYLADGSEYTGDYDLDEDGLIAFHRRRWHVLAGAGADLLACETIPSIVEVRALVRLLEETPGARAWIAFSCRDGERISDGTGFGEAVEAAAASPAVVAVGVNCTAPRHIASLVRIALETTPKPIVVYPNSGEVWEAQGRRWSPGSEPADLATLAVEWRRLGASLLGGCCRTGPEEIRRLRRALLREP